MPARHLIRRQRIASATTLAVGLALTALGAWFLERTYERLRMDQVAAQTESATTAVRLALDRVGLAVRAVQGMYAADIVTGDEFSRFAKTLTNSEGFRSLSFLRRVETENREAYSRRFATEPARSLGIWQYGPDGKPVAAGERPAHFVIESAYFVTGDQPPYGLDVAADPHRAEAIREAIDGFRLVVTEPVELFNARADGIIFYIPAFDRNGGLIGLASASVTLSALAGLAQRTTGVQGVAISSGEAPPPDAEKPSGTTTQANSFVYGGRVWTISVTSSPSAAAGVMRWATVLILLAGLASTLAVLGYIASASKTAQIAETRAQLQGMLDGLGPLAWLIRPDGTVIGVNRAAADVLRQPADAMIGRHFWDLPVDYEGPDEQALIRQAVAAANQRQDTRFDVPVEIDGERHVLDLWVRPLGADTRTGNLVASAVDVTDRHQAQETQRLLMRELDHRMKNALQVIQAIIRRTARAQVTVPLFEQSLLGRIRAMSRAHELLAGERWLGADIDTIVRQEAGSFDVGGVIRIGGPPVRLNPKAALSFALAMHELGTNASKYGALSVPGGRVEISWNVERQDGEAWLVIRWQESGGPPVKAPEERGFGSMLIERSIAYELGGDAVLEFRDSGLVCTIKAPMQTIRPFVGERTGEPAKVA